MAVTSEQVLAALRDLKDPSSGRPLSELGMLKGAEALSGSAVRVQIELPTPASPHKARIEESVRAPLSPLQLSRGEVAFSANAPASPATAANASALVQSAPT